MFKKWNYKISIRRVHVWMILTSVLMSGIVVFASFRLIASFYRIMDAYEENTELQKAAHELMDASDYLTEQVQRFTITGDKAFMERYFTEAFESKRREDAISKMNGNARTEEALQQLQNAMDHSVKLMDQEYYAMRLVIEAKGYTDYPEVLRGIKLREEDAVLSPDEKIRRATELVLNDDYYEQKDRIRKDMHESLDEIDKLADQMESVELATLTKNIHVVRAVIFLHAATIILLLCLTSHFGLNPILKAVDRIKTDNPIPDVGAKEFKYLAQAYNKMYAQNKTSLERLNYKVSHDELTGAYNRAGYDFLLSNIDIRTTHMMLIDVDDFKSINDNYGHEVGDKILIKMVQVLQGVFRDDDCICRIGGDEFVVFMVHSSGMPRRSIESKIEQINRELENTEDGMPPITISVGIINGKKTAETDNLFEKIDAAMYESKKQGKHTYTFYSAS